MVMLLKPFEFDPGRFPLDVCIALDLVICVRWSNGSL